MPYSTSIRDPSGKYNIIFDMPPNAQRTDDVIRATGEGVSFFTYIDVTAIDHRLRTSIPFNFRVFYLGDLIGHQPGMRSWSMEPGRETDLAVEFVRFGEAQSAVNIFSMSDEELGFVPGREAALYVINNTTTERTNFEGGSTENSHKAEIRYTPLFDVSGQPFSYTYNDMVIPSYFFLMAALLIVV